MSVKVTDEIKSAILSSSDQDVTRLSRELRERFGVFIPATVINSVLSEATRHAAVRKVKGRAGESLEKGFDVLEHVSGTLLQLFDRQDLSLKDRVEVAKELRQWTSKKLEMAGIHDEEGDVLFVVSPDWDVTSKE